MRVLFSSTRGSGHLQPLLPYAKALRQRGHEVLIAAPAQVSESLRTADLPHAPFGHPGDDALGPIWQRLSGISIDEQNAIALREIFAGANAQAALPKLRETIRTWRPALVVRESAELAAPVAAEAAGVPHVRVSVHMASFEDQFLFPNVAAPMDTLRGHAGLSPDGGAFLRAEPVFAAFPASLDRRADGTTTRVPFRVRIPTDAPKSDEAPWLRAADGRPLLYITFGTIAGSTPRIRWIYRASLDAVADLPVWALLTTGPGLEADALGPIPANVHVEAWVPQGDVLPHAAAVVCHGGSGTMLGALAAGVPLVVAPLGADQQFNAGRVAAAGAGLAVPNPDPATLRAAMSRVLEDTDLRRGARRIADEMAALPTIDAAVDALVGLAGEAERS